MSADPEPRVLEGRVFTGGVAQRVTREDGVTRILIAVLDGVPAVIRFPEPVTVAAGETFTIEVEQVSRS